MEAAADCLTADDLWADTNNVKFVVSLIVLLSINILVIGGNTLVILAVAKSKKLRSVTNLFIVSLAFADLFLGIAILPFSTMLEVLHVWVFGRIWCVMYLAIDVWLCTASILNLVAISLDRYIAITHPMRYPSLMSRRRAKCLIAGVWVFAFIVCLPPLLNWGSNDDQLNGPVNSTVDILTGYDLVNSSDQIAVMSEVYEYNPGEGEPNDVPYIVDSHKPKNCTDLSYLSCELTSSKGYRIYASIGSFYFPMCVMAFFYLRIYKTAVETAEALRKGTLTTKTEGENLSNNVSITLRVHRGRAYGKPSWKDKKRKETEREMHADTGRIRLNKACKTYSQEISHKKNKSKQKKSYQSKTEKMCSSSTNRHGYVHTFKRFHASKQQSPCPIGLNVTTPSGHICKNPSADTASLSSGSDIAEPNKPSYAANDDSNHLDDKGQKVGLVAPDEQARRRSGAFNFKVVRKNPKTHRSKFRRETKAAKTLAIIVGVFILCWLPFFTMYLVEAFCIDCIPPLVFSIFFWLGYFNSALNPCIYALFSRDFRSAFKTLLTCRKHYTHNTIENTSHVLRNMQVQTTFRESNSLSEF